MLTIYKASAGSGKTFRLVVEYLKLILANPYNYKHILAVTFTNKATNEMKSRILEQLNLLAQGEKSSTIEVLLEETQYTEHQIRQKASQTLKNILHDYNRFSVNTIDSFTQKVIKSFNRELGISPNYTLELDNEIILEEAVQRLFDKISDNKNLRKWLREFSRERIEDNRSQQIESEIKNLGAELFKESFQEYLSNEKESDFNRNDLDEFIMELAGLKATFENTLKKKGRLAVNEMQKAGLGPADFSGGARSSIGVFFVKLSNGNLPNFTDTVRKRGKDAEIWVTKNNKRRVEIIALAEQILLPLLSDIITYYDTYYPQYNTVLAVQKQIRTLGILIDLKDEIRELLREKGILPLSDSNLLLSKIIGESDTPFVYEKIGNYYKYFMLDEFQDTSDLQWKNFKPLIANSLAEGNNNLIVGDVKQSIYRWRNSDWNILAQKLQDEFTEAQRKEKTLAENFRSDRNIIEFNNRIMKAMIGEFENRLFVDIPDEFNEINRFRNIYSSYEQKPGNPIAPETGFVQANFLPAESFTEDSTRLLIEQVKMLQDKGIEAEEIAILIRKNKEGAPIIQAFLEAARKPENVSYDLTVLSNESLFLHASKGVLFIINLLEVLIDSNNEIAKATLLFMWQSWLKPELANNGFGKTNFQKDIGFEKPENWYLKKNYEEEFDQELSELVDEIRNHVLLSSLDEAVTKIASKTGLFEITAELPFIQTLIDKAAELKTSLSNDLSNFIFWWHEKGYLTSVSINEEIRSIRLLTVHKAKGLEYKAVLIPYFDWNTGPSSFQSPMLWCKPTNAPFTKFPLLPVQYGTLMKESEFAPDYYEEKVNNYIDTLNLVYVAFTRAKSSLIINSKQITFNKNGKESSSTSIDRLFVKAIQSELIEKNYPTSFNESEHTFSYGNFPEFRKEKPATNVEKIDKYKFHDLSDRIRLRMSGEDFLIESEQVHSEKNIGTLVHEILSDIETKKDIEPACTKALKEGKITEREYSDILKQIELNLNIERVQNWFDGTFTVLNERDLLSDKFLLRPDRIMYRNDTAIVVDYKTGEKIPGKYNRQVKRYAKNLKATGFKKVSGYLWYLGSKEIEEVCVL